MSDDGGYGGALGLCFVFEFGIGFVLPCFNFWFGSLDWRGWDDGTVDLPVLFHEAVVLAAEAGEFAVGLLQGWGFLDRDPEGYGG